MRSLLRALLLLGPVSLRATLPAQDSDPPRIRAAVDSIAGAALGSGRVAGVSIGVVRGKDTLVLKGYGMADLELEVPTPPRAVYEIASVTKQFTAASILLLAEQGQLSLDDPLTRYLPNYPMQGHTVTIRRLLDHTSGIAGYTEIPAFETLMAQRLPRDTLVKLFSSQPFKFAPGDALAYNNSAYFLLGLIIEKVTGGTYAAFVQKHLFDMFGMPDSRYCDQHDVIKGRVEGYDYSQGRLVPTQYLDHTWPFAAGSLCSTVWDLVAWSQELHGGRVLTPASYRLMTTPAALNDGTGIRYAMGLVNDSIGGRLAIHHSGDINGFQSDLAYFPDDQLTIAVLMNTAGPVSATGLLRAIAAVVHGREAVPSPVALDHPLSDYAGTYRGVGVQDSLTVTVLDSAGIRFRLAPAGPQATAGQYVGNDSFMIGRSRFSFVRSQGKVRALKADLVTLVTVLAKR